MPKSNYGPASVRAKTNEVVAYHRDETTPGRPLHLLIPGGLVALASLALIVVVVFQTWFGGDMAESQGLLLILLLAPIYAGGVFLFSYGYELYDVPRALRLTAIIVFLTFAAVIILAVLLVLLGGSRSKSSKSLASTVSQVSGGGGSSGGRSGWSPLNVFVPGHTITREVVREVEHVVPVEPPRPQPIACDHCGRPYLPTETNFICPSCGAPAPAEMMPPAANHNAGETTP